MIELFEILDGTDHLELELRDLFEVLILDRKLDGIENTEVLGCVLSESELDVLDVTPCIIVIGIGIRVELDDLAKESDVGRDDPVNELHLPHIEHGMGVR